MSKEVVLNITDLAYGGQGVGRTEEGKVCFVPDVIPGERVVACLVRERRDFAEGKLIEILQISPDRVAPPCEYFGRCGGCSYQHISYPAQLRAKERQVATTLQRIGGFSDIQIRPIVAANQPYNYRNRITVHTKEGVTGFYDRTGRKVMNIHRCMIASEPVNQALTKYRQQNPYDGVRTLRATSLELPGFYQTNELVATLLLEEVAKEAGEGELLVDAYCGSGFFAKRLRTKFQRVIGLEWNEHAVSSAQREVLPNETYWQGDAAELLPSALACAPGQNSVLILNPPAQGVSPSAIQAILDRPCKRIVYVSCNVATLARDLKKLALSYRPVTIIPFDMFPQTAEIETIAVLEQR